jgi:hypothetical protein
MRYTDLSSPMGMSMAPRMTMRMVQNARAVFADKIMLHAGWVMLVRGSALGYEIGHEIDAMNMADLKQGDYGYWIVKRKSMAPLKDLGGFFGPFNPYHPAVIKRVESAISRYSIIATDTRLNNESARVISLTPSK